MARILFLFLLIVFFQFTIAQKAVEYDTSRIVARSFAPSAMNKYKSDPAFRYEVVAGKTSSWWERFWIRFWERLGNMVTSEGGKTATKVLIISIAIIILVTCFMIFLGMGKDGLFGKKSNDEPLGYAVTDEDIHTLNFEDAIEEAITNGNLRLAVRLLYLQALKRLADGGLIDWQLNKTNIAYVQELQGSVYQPVFKKLTMQFENNWYGNIPIDRTHFEEVREQFKQFNLNLP